LGGNDFRPSEILVLTGNSPKIPIAGGNKKSEFQQVAGNSAPHFQSAVFPMAGVFVEPIYLSFPRTFSLLTWLFLTHKDMFESKFGESFLQKCWSLRIIFSSQGADFDFANVAMLSVASTIP